MPEAKTYTGGCHCGKIRYEVTTDLDKVMSCNCSHCSKRGLLPSFVPTSQFRLVSGDGDLSEYRFNTGRIAHLFCRHCGIQSFATGKDRDGTELVAVNVRCLDDVDVESLTLTPVNGRDL